MLGCDASGLELRMLAHYMARHDGGLYGKELLEGDIHQVNADALGLPRNDAKTFIYAFLYGAGNGKLGSIVGKGPRFGGQLRKKFLRGVPALKKLSEGVGAAAGRGYLKGLDGGDVKVRHMHAALNTLLQSAGAIVCKQWMVEFHRMAEEQGLDKHFDQVLWVHDELQCEADEEFAERVGQLMADAVTEAGEKLNLRIRLDGDYQIGDTWRDTH